MWKAGYIAVLAVLTGMFAAGCRSNVVDPVAESCAPAAGDPVTFGFYAFYEPVSYSANPNPASPEFLRHSGYEADLLTALETMERRLVFVRQPIADWPGIWLLPATPEFDIVGGGITILESRTVDPTGRPAIAFTSGHIAFRQSLLVRSEDSGRLASYDDLKGDVRVGVFRGGTGEARLLQITGIASDDGVLVHGTKIETPAGSVVADGTARYTITAAAASPALEDRTHIFPPSTAMPQAVHLWDLSAEAELLAALRDGIIDVVARGEIGSLEAARASGNALVVSAVDSLVRYGGFALDAGNAEMLRCIDERLDWLTGGRRIGYAEWRADPAVFLARAAAWNGGS